MTVNYALPTADFNPYADFDLGCVTKFDTANGDQGWGSERRSYRVVSGKAWSYAGFSDPSRLLTAGDVAPFEMIARTLLARSIPAAHGCTLPGNGKATPVPETWNLGFSARTVIDGLQLDGGSRGTFTTKPTLTGSASDVTGLDAPDFVVQVTTYCASISCVAAQANGAGVQESFTVHFDGNILAFTANTKLATATLELGVAVTNSSYPGCTAGATGILTITAGPTTESLPSQDVELDACGSELFQPSTAGTGTFMGYIGRQS